MADESTKALAGLGISKLAHYVNPRDGIHNPAIVVSEGDGTGADAVLLVIGLPQEGLFYVPVSAFDAKTKANGTWHWPESVS